MRIDSDYSTEVAVMHAEGASMALSGYLLHEFSEGGGDGVIEIRFVNGRVIGVFVRAIEESEKTKPANERGKIAGWELTPDELAVLHAAKQ